MTTVRGQLAAADLMRLDRLRERLVAEAERAGRRDLLEILDELREVDRDDPLRVCVVGETCRGKSTLLNTLIGRPLLSPVGAGVTTSCWVKVSHGERDEAVVLLANRESLAEPIRRPCDIREVQRYIALDQLREPVIGVELRVPAPALRDLNLEIIDTPGVGGLTAGHSRLTLNVLRTADALLFVCDCKQPILAPEMEFLVEAAQRVPTVVVAVTKCDVSPDYERVVADTRRRIQQTAGLEHAPVLAVAPPLHDRAASADPERAGRLRRFSGIEELLSTIYQHTSAVSAAVRLENAGRALAEVSRTLIARSDELAELLAGHADRERELQDEIDGLRAIAADRPLLTLRVHEAVDRLRREPADSFDVAIRRMRTRYSTEAEKGTASALSTLPSRLAGDVTAAAVESLERTTQRSTEIVGDLLRDLGGADRWPETARTTSARFVIGLEPPGTSTRRSGADLAASAQLFTRLVELLGGTAVVVSAFTGPGIIAASLAVAAAAGWWKARAGTEHEERARLLAWVDAALTEATSTFHAELNQRVTDVERQVTRVLPELIRGREQELVRLTEELAGIRATGRDLYQEQAVRQVATAGLRELEQEVDALVARAREARLS